MICLRVTDVRLVPAHARNGLLGYVSCTIGDLRIDGLALRRTRCGRYSISMPRRRGYAVVRPLTSEGTRSMEAQILAQLGLEAAP